MAEIANILIRQNEYRKVGHAPRTRTLYRRTSTSGAVEFRIFRLNGCRAFVLIGHAGSGSAKDAAQQHVRCGGDSDRLDLLLVGIVGTKIALRIEPATELLYTTVREAMERVHIRTQTSEHRIPDTSIKLVHHVWQTRINILPSIGSVERFIACAKELPLPLDRRFY